MTPIERARAAREEARAAMVAAADAYEALGADATEEARTAASEAFDEAERTFQTANAEHERQVRLEAARSAQPSPDPAPVRVVREPLTYDRRNVENSYFYDIARIEFGRGDVEGARARLSRHATEVRTEVERREAMHARALDAGLDELLESSGLPEHLQRALREHGLVTPVQQRDIGRVDGAGGEFVPPLWMLDQFAEAARAGRPFMDEIGRQIPLPAGTDSINIPRITTGTLTGMQTADNAAVTEQDLVTNSVNAPVRTIAGQIDVALQLLEQSPIGMDQILFADLLSDHAMQLDIQGLNGSGAAGQLLGILNVAGIGAITYTDATPTVPELYKKLAGAVNGVSDARKRVPSHFWWAGRRWFWAASEVDASQRPFFVSSSGGPMNAYGQHERSTNEGPVTNVLGVDVHLDLNVPTNLGGGTNEDRIIATVMDDHVLFEGDIRARVLKEVLSGTLTARLQVYSYVAFTAGRFPAATSVIAGTGLTPPVF